VATNVTVGGRPAINVSVANLTVMAILLICMAVVARSLSWPASIIDWQLWRKSVQLAKVMAALSASSSGGGGEIVSGSLSA